jgi:hypothetical protein
LTPLDDFPRQLAGAVVDAVFPRYIAERRARVKLFCARHFSVAGAWRIHRAAWGHDLWKAPANALWAGPYLLSRGAAALFGRAGWLRAARLLADVPPGFKTAVACDLEWLIYTELLELPISQETRHSEHDALLEAVAADGVIKQLVGPELLEMERLAAQPEARRKLEDFLAIYAHSRTAAAELSGSLLSLAAGAGSLGQFTPGSAALGQAAAAAVAHQVAVANFALGPTLGQIYYTLFPATAPAGLVIATVGGLMLALGTITALTGIVTDPVQQALGLHERRLHRLIDALEKELRGQNGTLQLRDAYLARLIDVIDLIRAGVRAMHP